MNKNVFLRKDWQTYKSKFKPLCSFCVFAPSLNGVQKFKDREIKERKPTIKIEELL